MSTSLIIGDGHDPEGGTIWSLPGNPKEDILTLCEGGFGQTFQPAERSSAGERHWTQSNIRFSGAMSIDTTRPFIYKDAFERARYNVEVIDLRSSTRSSRSPRQGRPARLRQVPRRPRDLTQSSYPHPFPSPQEPQGEGSTGYANDSRASASVG